MYNFKEEKSKPERLRCLSSLKRGTNLDLPSAMVLNLRLRGPEPLPVGRKGPSIKL